MKRRLYHTVLCCAAGAILLGALHRLGWAAEPARSVLVVYADSRQLPAVVAFDEAVRNTLGGQFEVFSEFLDIGRFGDERYMALAAQYLRQKYAAIEFHAIIAGAPIALDFLLQHRDEILPAIPVIHAVVAPEVIAGKTLPADVVGVPAKFDAAATIDLALKLHPAVRRVLVIAGSGRYDRLTEALVRRDLQPLSGRVALDFWVGLPIEELESRLAALPPDSLVFAYGMLQDNAGRVYNARDALARMARASPVPVYGAFDTHIGAGIVGGNVLGIEDSARQAAAIVLRLRPGEVLPRESLPKILPNHYVFDWRQLKRWGIREQDLPADSIVKFREPSFWHVYRWYIIAVMAILVLEAALIGFLLVERRSRRRAEAELREGERRMSLAANAAGMAMWFWDIPRDNVWTTEQRHALLGTKASPSIDLARFLDRVHAEDRHGTRKAIEAALAGNGELDRELRVVDGAGETRWLAVRGRTEFSADGRPQRMRGVSRDITARKEAEIEARSHREDLAHVSRVNALGQLSGALAHELNQPLTAILSNAQAAQRFLEQKPVDLDELREILADIVADDERAGDVIGRLRALLKRGEAELKPLDVNRVVRDVELLLHGEVVTRNVTLETQLRPSLGPVKGDKIQLQQVLINLIVNGCDAVAENPPEERIVTVSSEWTNGDVVISVGDRGRGIGAEHMKRIFEPFVTTKSQGIGLGLSISRAIVAAHGGRLTARNNPGRGATFEIALPAQDAVSA